MSVQSKLPCHVEPPAVAPRCWCSDIVNVSYRIERTTRVVVWWGGGRRRCRHRRRRCLCSWRGLGCSSLHLPSPPAAAPSRPSPLFPNVLLPFMLRKVGKFRRGPSCAASTRARPSRVATIPGCRAPALRRPPLPFGCRPTHPSLNCRCLGSRKSLPHVSIPPSPWPSSRGRPGGDQGGRHGTPRGCSSKRPSSPAGATLPRTCPHTRENAHRSRVHQSI